MLRRRALPVFLVVGIFALGACGSGDDGGERAATTAEAGTGAGGDSGGSATDIPDIDACSLLTSEQVSAVLGGPVDAPTPNSTPASTGCGWFSTSGKPGDGVTLTIQPLVVFDGTVKVGGASGYSFEQVDGLGDDAFFLTPETTSTNPILSVKDGSTTFAVFVKQTGTPVEKIRAGEEQLARDVLAAL
ncbi:MAG: hypothetical protein ACKO04_14590 [Actinomycetes bacterium]